MLILTRKLGECIRIGSAIQVKILNVNGKQVRIGIDAPENFPIHRQEVYNRIQEENINAALNASKVTDPNTLWREKEE